MRSNAPRRSRANCLRMSSPAERPRSARVPDIPQWVDTRGMLLTGRALISFPPDALLDAAGFVVELASRALLSASDDPPPALMATRALRWRATSIVLCSRQPAPVVAQALPGWCRQPVRLHALPGRCRGRASRSGGLDLHAGGGAAARHVPETLREELTEALEGHPAARFVPGALPPDGAADASPAPIPMAAAWVGRPAGRVLLPGAADRNAVGRLGRHAGGLSRPRTGGRAARAR